MPPQQMPGGGAAYVIGYPGPQQPPAPQPMPRPKPVPVNVERTGGVLPPESVFNSYQYQGTQGGQRVLDSATGLMVGDIGAWSSTSAWSQSQTGGLVVEKPVFVEFEKPPEKKQNGPKT